MRSADTQGQPNASAVLRQGIGRRDHGGLQRESREVVASVPALLIEQVGLAGRWQLRVQIFEGEAFASVCRVELLAVAPLASFRVGVVRRHDRKSARS